MKRNQKKHNNSKKKKLQSKKWRESNPDYGKCWRENHPNYSRQYSKKYHENNKNNNIEEITNMLYQINPTLKEKNVKAYGYIYRVTGPNNHFYIGQTVLPLVDRYRHGIKSWIKERIEKDKPKFIDELKEEENFSIDIIDYGICRYHLDKLEAHYINKYNSCDNGYNNREGNYKTSDGIEEFNKILEENGLKFINGKLTKKVM